ncbi:hypothetical protein BDBG_17472 [Blastomyces gilchristii SLH14081]|uniref:Uncharacterized protein n=1 Tax=Blastomyces gilchristii (strain SLH14081) TaxID=559298 RepID=A0A179UVX1_BLAGS|nr:uncharacterized protein BDBG_17472 [Blastomyces gilchristii SLH14081]OAT11237.1 hypothetical protein BDBG_17472 [Blastomyces gilchristii SLH14081]
MLIEGGGGVAMAVEEAGNEPDTDEPTSRRDNTSLQCTVTTATAVREAEEDVTIRAVLSQLINTAVSAFN